MRLFGRWFSNWWLALLVVPIVVGVPLVLFMLIVAGHVVGGLVGPPGFWNRTSHSPARADLVGVYRESFRDWDRPKSGPGATLELRADGSMQVSGLPDDSITSVCVVSGRGRWTGPDDRQEVALIVNSDGSPGTCTSAMYGPLELVGHSEPYGFYWILGDPDSAGGIWLKRE